MTPTQLPRWRVDGYGPQEVARCLSTGQEARGQRHPERVLDPQQQLDQLQAPNTKVFEGAVERHGEPRGVRVDLDEPPDQFKDEGSALCACI